MGVNTWAAFTVTPYAKALVDGDVAAYESELQGVLKNLRKAGLYVTAIHNRLTGGNTPSDLCALLGRGPGGGFGQRDPDGLERPGSKETKSVGRLTGDSKVVSQDADRLTVFVGAHDSN